MFGKKKLTAFDADYINNLLKQVHESETIVNRTTNPTKAGCVMWRISAACVMFPV